MRGQAEGVLGVFRWFNVLETGILKCPSEISCQFIFILYPKKKKKPFPHFENWIRKERAKRRYRSGADPS